MLTHQAFRYELAPTSEQRVTLANHAGAARWAWNWGLAVRRKAWHRRRQTLSAVDLHRLLNRPEHTPRFAWLYEVSKCAPQEALRDLDRAYANYRRGQKNGRNRVVSRKQSGSTNRRKSALALARLHRRIRNQRLDALHKATTALAKTKSVIVVEDLHVAGMVRNRHLARVISDQGWAQFHRQLAYKCQWHGSRLLVAPRFYPSSKACSSCGLAKAELPLNVRTFRCEACGPVIDRDENAARNLAALAASGSTTAMVAGSSLETKNACGEESAGPTVIGGVQLASAKQERAHRRLANA
jgi:IS605 OrfB family transposase